jgi:hypothetical protein
MGMRNRSVKSGFIGAGGISAVQRVIPGPATAGTRNPDSCAVGLDSGFALTRAPE